MWLAITNVNAELYISLEAAAAHAGAGLVQLVYDEKSLQEGVARNLKRMQALYTEQAYFWEIVKDIVDAISNAVQYAMTVPQNDIST